MVNETNTFAGQVNPNAASSGVSSSSPATSFTVSPERSQPTGFGLARSASTSPSPAGRRSSSQSPRSRLPLFLVLVLLSIVVCAGVWWRYGDSFFLGTGTDVMTDDVTPEAGNPLGESLGAGEAVTLPVDTSAAAAQEDVSAQVEAILANADYFFERYEAATFKSEASSDLAGFVAVGSPISMTADSETSSESQPGIPVPQSTNIVAQVTTRQSRQAKIVLVVSTSTGLQVKELTPADDGTLQGWVSASSSWDSIKIVAVTDDQSVGTGEVLMLVTGTGV